MNKGITFVIGLVVGGVIAILLIIGLVVGGWFYIDYQSTKDVQEAKKSEQKEEQTKTEKPNENNPNSTPTDKISEKAAGVTLANFNKISTGMTYQKVVEILGSKGEVILDAGTGSIVYMWEGERNTNITAMFVDGKLDSKNQIGLK